MIEFIRKFENRGIKSARVKSILITKYVYVQLFTFILYGVGARCDRCQFSVLSPLIEKTMIEPSKLFDKKCKINSEKFASFGL